MAIDAATNCWTNAEEDLKTAIANSATFWTFVGAADAAEAAAYVFVDLLDEPKDGEAFSWQERAEIGAYALIGSSRDNPFRWTWDGDNEAIPSGRLVLLFERMVTPPDETTQTLEKDSNSQVDRWFKNRIATVLEEVGDYWRNNGGPVPRIASVTDGPAHTAFKQRRTSGHWQGCEAEFTWGQTQ